MGGRIAAVGEIVEDCYLDDADAEERHLGGISVNFARSARHAGANVALFGAVGSDDRGARMQQALEDADLDQWVRTLPGTTARQRIRLAPDGERIFCGFDQGVLPDYQPTGRELGALAQFDAVAVPCSPECLPSFRALAAAPWAPDRLVADFSQDNPVGDPTEPASWIEPWGERLLVAFMSGSAANEAALRALSSRVAALIVLTVGEAGAYAFRGGASFYQPALAREVVDTTGCGDAFQAGFTLRYLDARAIEASLLAGSDLAAHVALRRGAAP